MEMFTTALFSAMLLPLMLIGAVPLFIYVYAILRWRAGSGAEPGMGSYSLVLMFRLISLLLSASCISLLLYVAMSEEDHDELKRICWPVLVASLAFQLFQWILGLYIGSPDRFVPARRIFGGGLVAISGLVTLGALIALLVTLWERVPENPESFGAKGHSDRLVAFGAWLGCYGAVYLISSLRMARTVGGGSGA